GIRDLIVTGVQTCALPIFPPSLDATAGCAGPPPLARPVQPRAAQSRCDREVKLMAHASFARFIASAADARPEAPELLFKPDRPRSEERRVGKGRQTRGSER